MDENDKKEVKVRKIADKDFKKVETSLKNEFGKRKDSTYRTRAETIWKEVDRQVSLEPLEFINPDDEDSWLSAFELGTLANASEIMTADILRTVFPDFRTWFENHIEIEPELDPNSGEPLKVDEKYQLKVDGKLRAFLTQQHEDFGLRARVELSVKEGLHHGGFVAECKWESMDMYFDGTTIKSMSSPVWVPHSMWNCYPDPSPSLVGDSMFYQGSMFIKYYQPRNKLMEEAQDSKDDGWIMRALKKVPRRENDQKENKTNDVEVVVYWGDVIIPKGSELDATSKEDLYYPHMKAILANGKLVYLKEIETPYIPIVYCKYEQMDVRDPYGTSPLIKQSPMQKIGSIMANEFVNGAQLKTRPPIVYDGNDPDFVVNGGPRISPGAKVPTKGNANFKTMDVGDPQSTLSGLQFILTSMREALGRPGMDVGDRATAQEVLTKQADSEAGPFGFAIKLDQALRTFLYMQFYMNKKAKGWTYTYYNPELDSPDFDRVKPDELPDSVHFEVTGSKSVLGEYRRMAAFTQATSFLSQNPLFSQLLDKLEIAKEIYRDTGMKNPERFLQQGGVPPELMQAMGTIRQLQGALVQEKQQTAVKMKKMGLDFIAKMEKLKVTHIHNVAKIAQSEAKAEREHDVGKIIDELKNEIQSMIEAQGGQEPASDNAAKAA